MRRNDTHFPAQPKKRLLDMTHAVDFPIQSIRIDWDRLMAKRPLVLATCEAMPGYLIKPEVLALLDAEPDPQYRLIMDLMWSTGARTSEILSLKPESFIDDGYDFGVLLKSLKQGAGRPSKHTVNRSPKRYVPIQDKILQERIHAYLYRERFRKSERIFKMTRQTIYLHVTKLAKQLSAESAPFKITPHTLRHSFAIHLLLHGRPLKYVSQLLGHKTIQSTEVYTRVLTVDGGHLLQGVEFH